MDVVSKLVKVRKGLAKLWRAKLRRQARANRGEGSPHLQIEHSHVLALTSKKVQILTRQKRYGAVGEWGGSQHALTSTNVQMLTRQKHAVGALANLSMNVRNKARIVQDGGLPRHSLYLLLLVQKHKILTFRTAACPGTLFNRFY